MTHTNKLLYNYKDRCNFFLNYFPFLQTYATATKRLYASAVRFRVAGVIEHELESLGKANTRTHKFFVSSFVVQ